jgi:hypothetical protein
MTSNAEAGRARQSSPMTSRLHGVVRAATAALDMISIILLARFIALWENEKGKDAITALVAVSIPAPYSPAMSILRHVADHIAGVSCTALRHLRLLPFLQSSFRSAARTHPGWRWPFSRSSRPEDMLL